nr:hypothetical protein GCM10020093_096670 [Planobispora longispora]
MSGTLSGSTDITGRYASLRRSPCFPGSRDRTEESHELRYGRAGGLPSGGPHRSCPAGARRRITRSPPPGTSYFTEPDNIPCTK